MSNYLLKRSSDCVQFWYAHEWRPLLHASCIVIVMTSSQVTWPCIKDAFFIFSYLRKHTFDWVQILQVVREKHFCDDNLGNMMMTSSGVKLHCFKDSFSPLVVCAFCRGWRCILSSEVERLWLFFLFLIFNVVPMQWLQSNLINYAQRNSLFLSTNTFLVFFFFPTFSPYSDKSFHPPTLVVYFIRSSSNLAHT